MIFGFEDFSNKRWTLPLRSFGWLVKLLKSSKLLEKVLPPTDKYKIPNAFIGHRLLAPPHPVTVCSDCSDIQSDKVMSSNSLIREVICLFGPGRAVARHVRNKCYVWKYLDICRETFNHLKSNPEYSSPQLKLVCLFTVCQIKRKRKHKFLFLTNQKEIEVAATKSKSVKHCLHVY